MRLRLALLSFFLTSLVLAQDFKPVGVPESNKNDFLSLPDPQEVSSKRRVVTIRATTKDEKAEVEWLVFNTEKETIETLASGKTLMIFPNDLDDVIMVLCYVKKSADGASSPVRTLITVKSGGKKPTPTPTPTSGKRASHVTFVVADPTRLPPEVRAITDDPAFRQYLAAFSMTVHKVAQNAKIVTEGGLVIGVRKAGSIPCVILQDAGGNILDAAPITSLQSVKDLVDKYKGD